MLPDSAVTLLAFLLLASPGLLFEWMRRNHRPAAGVSVFEEIATVVIASLVFVSFSATSLAVVNLFATDLMAEVRTWHREGAEYFVSQPERCILTIVLAVVLSWTAAVGANLFLSSIRYQRRVRPLARRAMGLTDEAELGKHPVWWSLLRGRVPEGTTGIFLTIEVDGGRLYTGRFHGYDTAGSPEARVMVLGRPLTTRVGSGGVVKLDPEGHWQLLVVPMAQIRSATLLYAK